MENQPPARGSPQSLKDDSEIKRNQFLLTVSKDGLSLRHGHSLIDGEDFTKDKKVVLAAVTNNGLALEFADDSFKSDEDVVFTSSTSSNSTMHNGLKYASPELRNNKNFIITILQVNGLLLEKVSEEFQNDKDVVLAAIKNNYFAFNYASYDLRNDRDFILPLVQRNGSRFLLFASNNLLSDRLFVLASVINNGKALLYVSDELRNDKELVFLAMNNYDIFSQLSSEITSDRDITLEAVNLNGCNLEYTSNKNKRDPEIVIAAIKNGGSLRFAHKNLRGNKDFIKEVFEIDPTILEDISVKLKSDKYFLYYLDEITKITSIEGFAEMIDEDIANNLVEDQDYLLQFAPPVNYKPAKG
jgi:hypothetical protein